MQLLRDDMDISDSDEDSLPEPPKRALAGSAHGVWTSVGNVSTYKACPKERCFPKKLDDNICPTCSMPIDEEDQAISFTASAGFRLEGAQHQITDKMFTNTLKSAYTQFYPNCTLSADLAVLEDEFF